MTYKYHVQQKAEDLANSMLPVPEYYPAKNGLPADYPEHFLRFHELMKEMYFDMAKQPEAYGLKLVALNSKDKDLIEKSNKSINRVFETLYCFVACGEIQNYQIVVSLDKFKAAIKKGGVSRYELVLSQLVNFGFSISDFHGKAFGKDIQYFVVEYPDYPELVETIKQFYDCLLDIRADESEVKLWPNSLHYRVYRRAGMFDYKVTADIKKLPVEQWIADEGKYDGISEKGVDFCIAFYKYSLNYEGITFSGNYFKKSKQLVRYSGWHPNNFITFILDKDCNYMLKLYLKNITKYASKISTMPEKIQKMFTTDYCLDCQEPCHVRISWEYENKQYRGCGWYCFAILENPTRKTKNGSKLFQDGIDVELIPHYWRLLELEHGLKKLKNK